MMKVERRKCLSLSSPAPTGGRQILAVDVGTTHLKAGVLGADGRLQRLAIRKLPVVRDETGRAEHDPETLWTRLVDAVREVVVEDPAGVRWMVLSAYQLGLLPVDESGAPLTGILTLQDTRSLETFPGLLERTDFRTVYQHTGCPPLFQYPLAKIEWLRTRRPEIFRSARWLLDAKAYLLLRLFGRPVTDFSTATASQLMDVRTLRWAPDLLALAGITEEQLPEAVAPETVLGPLRPEAAEALGLSLETEVIAGVYDGGAVGLGLGAIAPGVGVMNLGTTAMVRRAADHPVLDSSPRMRLQTYYLAGGLWFPGGAINNAGSTLQWLQELLGLDIPQQEARIDAKEPTDLLFLPFLTGERFPEISPWARGVLFGLRAHHGPGHLLRAAMEGVAFALRLVLEALAENGLMPRRLRAGGGGARSDLWMRILASVFGMPVEVPEIPEPALVGGAVLARVASGAAPDLPSAQMDMPVRVYEPVADWVPRYREQFHAFQALLADLATAFARSL
ncbi:MAG: gluconokinase [Anaerolineae bacterium]|nr:gluconokinase [Anaerolineae bacterium]MCX8068294.1 gluconokinase [Anaerolineae bacterium]MDW7992031.1 gluconokinase [Anaerolineae bacterium]